MTDLPDSTRWQLWIVAFGFFMQSLDTTIVNTALPSMAQSLGESPLHMHMVIVSYVLTVAVMLPASGWLADKVGVRNIFFTAIVLFTLGSLFCALSGDGAGAAGSRRRDDGAGRQVDGDENRTA